MKQTLTNDLLTVTIDTRGAELQSIVDNRTQHEYLWHGDKKFWDRRSPVLFPIVGSVWDATYRMDGKEYSLGQHGFARDCEFEVMTDTPENEAWFALEYSEETLKHFPRRFRLEIGYGLEETRLSVMWRVKNLDTEDMYFQIGAHPAFNYPLFDASAPVHGYMVFDNDNLSTQLLKEKGCIGYDEMKVELDSDKMLPVTATTFDINTIVLADNQVHRVSMLDAERRPYLSVLFTAPVVGIWSPAPDAPFVCIEPWYGRCDRAGYTGEFKDREYVNRLAPEATFDASYMIIFDNI
ncbi:MAG: aldose 1-epimerase family protein [Muribaculaceae bacterium]|nr:aldose 1-epimerase family protein [Muribaculaceae bacterium]